LPLPAVCGNDNDNGNDNYHGNDNGTYGNLSFAPPAGGNGGNANDNHGLAPPRRLLQHRRRSEADSVKTGLARRERLREHFYAGGNTPEVSYSRNGRTRRKCRS